MDDTNPPRPPPITPSSTNEGPKAPSETATSRMKRKTSRQTSEVWDRFTKFVNKQGDIKAICNCPKDFFVDPKINGTIVMKSHMDVCRSRINVSDYPSQAELVFESGNGESLGTWKFNQDDIRKG